MQHLLQAPESFKPGVHAKSFFLDERYNNLLLLILVSWLQPAYTDLRVAGLHPLQAAL